MSLIRTCLGLALSLGAAAAVAQTTADWPTGIGFQNVARTPGQLVAGPFAQSDGRAAIMAWHNGVLFTVPEVPSSAPNSNFQARMWNLSDTANPRIIARAPATDRGGVLGWSLGDTPMPINAHGYFHVGQNFGTGAAGHWLVVGADWPPTAPWSFRALAGVPGVTREASGHLGAGTRGSLFSPWHIDETWWSYGAISGLASIRYGGASFNPGSQLLSQWDHLGQTGVVGHPFLLGNLLIFASDQSRTGVATYDVSNPAQPVPLDVLKTGGPGGYWPELWGNDGELYIVFPYNDNGNGIRVVDATDPSNLRFVGDTALPRPNISSGAMYGQFQDEFAFIGDHKIDMRTRQSVLQFPAEAANIDMGQFALPIGNLLVAGGTGSAQAIGIFAHQADPDTRPPSVAYHIPRAGQSNYPRGAPISLLIHETLDTLSLQVGTSLQLRRINGPGSFGPALPGTWIFSFDDVLTFQPGAQLDANASYEFRVTGVRDVAGNSMPAYAFTFSTGAALGGNRPPVVDTVSADLYPAAVAATVTFSASAQDPDADTLQYRYDFGDGSAKTDWAASSSAQHAFATPGHYRVNVQARDPSGVIASRTTTVTVAAAPTGAPTQSSAIHCASTARRVFVANPDSNTVSVLNADSASLIAEYPTCNDPRSVALSGTNQLWVACFDDDRVQVLNPSNGALIGEINTGYGSAPVALAIDPASANVFVSLQNRQEVRRYNATTRVQTGALAVAGKPRALAISSDGSRVFATRFLSARHHGETFEINAATMTLVAAHRINKFGNDANRDTTASGKGVINDLAGAVLSPRTGRLFVTGNKPNNERGLLIHASQDLDTDNSVRNLLVELDATVPDPNARVRRAIDIDNSDSAYALAFSPLGDYLFVSLQGMNELVVFDALAMDQSTGLGSQVTRLAVGAAPQGVCVDPVTERTFVQNFMGRSVSVLDTTTLFRQGQIAPQRTDLNVVTNETLSPAVLLGKRVFYHAADPRMSAEGYLSCATCHLDGGEDGRVWDFTGRGEGLRNTTTLNGRGGTAQGNVHWSANFDEIQDFENDIRAAFGGSGFLTDPQFAATSAPLGAPKAGLSAELDGLAAYLSSLGSQSIAKSPFRNADGSFSANAQTGEGLFQREQCTSCHVPPAYTDSSLGTATLHDVGTLRETSGQRLGAPLTGIDTPGLRGLHATAPYFHDGSAPTLADVFRVTGGTRYPAEAAQLQGGASLQNAFVDLNNDDLVRGRAYASVDGTGQAIVFNNVAGGNGGTGAIEIRYSNSRTGAQTQALVLIVNGQTHAANAVPASNNSPTWRSTNWDTIRIENVPLNAGNGNVISIGSNGWYLSVDEILVSTAGDLGRAQAHRRVAGLPQGEQDALLAFLRELDGSPTPLGSIQLFANGFE